MQTKSLQQFVFVVIIMVGMAHNSHAQVFGLSDEYTFLETNGDTLNLALTGGINVPRFSMADINNDGLKDFFIFDRSGNKPIVLIFTLNKGYVHQPAYESVFPPLQDWAMFADYDNDGKEDLWGRNDYYNSVSLFRNVTQSGDKYIRFETVTNTLMAYNFNNPPLDSNQVACDKANVPAIVDIDSDGDMDFLTFQTFGFGVSLFLNNTIENKKPLHPPSFESADDCWGNFSSSSTSNEIFLKRYQFCRNPYYRYKKHSGGSSLLLFDADGDSDKDLLLGDAGYNDVIFLKNGKSENSLKYDTIVSFLMNYPTDDPIDVQLFPATSLVDLYHNGKPVLLASPSEMDERSYAINQKDAVQMYENVSAGKVVDFRKTAEHFLNTEILDQGAYSSPAVADIDADGWSDILLLTNGNQSKTKSLSDRIYFYKNLGVSGNGKYFQLVDEDLALISKDSLRECSINIADVDNDSKADLIIGKSDGTLSFYKNVTTGGNVKFQFVSHKWQNIVGGQLASPCLVDINADGLLDLLIGSYEGTLKYYKNTGTKSSAKFTPVSDSFGKILLNQIVRTTIFDADRNEWIDTLLPTSFGYSSVGSFISKTGQLTLTCGGDEGILRFFQPEAAKDGNYKEVGDFFFNSITHDKWWDIGSRLKLSVGDLNKDGYVDIVCGNSRGGISILSGMLSSGIEQSQMGFLPKLILYPNPATSLIQIDYKGNINSSHIYNLAGQLTMAANDEKVIDVSSLNPGSYFVAIKTADQGILNRKLIIVK